MEILNIIIYTNSLLNRFNYVLVILKLIGCLTVIDSNNYLIYSWTEKIMTIPN